MSKITEKNDSKVISSGCPECFGKRKIGRRCPDCEFDESCRIYGILNHTEKSGIKHFAKSTAPLNEELGNVYGENDLVLDEDEKAFYFKKDGQEIEVSGVNLKLAVSCLVLGAEKPRTARALALRLSGCKNLSDVAEYLGVTRQAIHTGIQNELGIGNRVLKDSSFKKLTPQEFRFYKLRFEDGCTSRSVAIQMRISKGTCYRLEQSIKNKLSIDGAKNGRKKHEKRGKENSF